MRASDSWIFGHEQLKPIALAEMMPANVMDIISHFQELCSENLGNAFTPNHLLLPGNGGHDSFQVGLEHLNSNARLAVVFHGTPSRNIPSILKDGLDPTKRTRQKFGVGEYFHRAQRGATVYADSGTVIVFVIVVPKPTLMQRIRKRGGIVVVNNNSHQLPIGTLIVKNQLQNKLAKQRDEILERRFQNIERKLEGLSQRDRSRSIATYIIRDLEASRIEFASELYKRYLKLLLATPDHSQLTKIVKGTATRCDQLKKSGVFASFPGLPPLEEPHVGTSEQEPDEVDSLCVLTGHCIDDKESYHSIEKSKYGTENRWMELSCITGSLVGTVVITS